MLDAKPDIGTRLKLALTARGITQGELAEAADVTPQAVGLWVRKGEIARERISLVCKKLGISADWLLTGAGTMDGSGANDDRGTYNVEDGPPLRSVPLISWVQAGQWNEAVDSFRPGKGEKMVWTSRKISAKTFALRVKGDSMENPQGRPTYPEGSIIVVDPEREAVHGNAVIVRLDNSKEATFKQLVILEGGERYLKPLNPRYENLKINGDATFCGVVVQTIMDED